MAMLAAAILALTAGLVLESASRSSRQQLQFRAMQEDARVAVTALNTLARSAQNSEVRSPSIGPSTTVFRVGASAIYRASSLLATNATGNSLVYEQGSAANKVVLNKGWVKSFSVSNVMNGIAYTLLLDNSNETLRVDGRAYFRN